MSDISILIVEDEELYADKMEMQLDKLGYFHQATVDNSEDALQEIRRSLPDLILMDVNIQGDYDGIELADKIHQQVMIPIIFITSLKDDMTFRRAKRTNPLAFLTKPFDEIQLQRTMELVISQLDTSSKKTGPELPNEELVEVFTASHFFVKNRQKLEKVLFKDIIYIKADGRYTQIVTQGRKYLIRKSFQDIQQRLNPQQFSQSHRSYILNLKKVSSVDLSEMVVYLGADIQAPLSKRMKDDFLNQLETI